MKTLNSYICLLVLLTVVEANGQDSLGITLVERRYDCWTPVDIAISDRGAFLALGDNGYIILRPQGNAFQVIERETTIEPHCATVVDDTILIMLDCLGEESRVIVSSTADPSHPIGQLELPYLREERWAFTDSILVCGRHSDIGEAPYYPDLIDVILIRRDGDPELLATVEGFSRLERMALTRERLFVDDGDSTIRIFDISDPSDPEELELLEFESSIAGMTSTTEMLAFLTTENRQEDQEGAFWLYDCSDPDDLELLFTESYWVNDYSPYRIALHLPYVDIFHNPSSSFAASEYGHYIIADSARLEMVWHCGFLWEEWITGIVDVEYDGDNPVWAIWSWAGQAGGLVSTQHNRHGELELAASYAQTGEISGICFANPDTIALFNGIIGGFPMLGDGFERIDEVTPFVSLCDASEPGNLEEIDRLLLERGGYSQERMVTDNNVAYYGGHHVGWTYYDMNDLDGREPLGMIPRGESLFRKDILKIENFLYVGTDETVKIFDISDADAPDEVGEIDFNLQGEIIQDGERLYLTSSHQVGVYDLENLESPEQLAIIESPRDQMGQRLQMFGTEVNGNILFYSTYGYDMNLRRNASVLHIYNLENLDNPRLLTEFEIPRYFWECHVGNGFLTFNAWQIIAGEQVSDIRIYDVHDPANPILVGRYRDDDYYGEFVIHGHFIYTADHDHLSIFDISAALGEQVSPVFRNPPVEILAREADTLSFDLLAVDLNGDSLEMTMHDDGVLEELGATFTDHLDGTASFIWQTNYDCSGQYRPVFRASDGESAAECSVSVVISNVNRLPSVPELVCPPDGSPIPEDSPVAFAWERSTDPDGENLNYLLKIIGPIDQFYLNTGDDTTRQILRSDLIYLLADRPDALVWEVSVTDGIDTVQCDTAFTLLSPLHVEGATVTPYDFHLSPPFPNPFNSSTTVTYGIPVAASVSLSLCDLTGRQVTTMVKGNQPVGIHRTMLFAADLPSGLYFVRLEAAERQFTRKLMLIR